MQHLNSIQIIGNVVREPEIRDVAQSKVAKVCLAVNTRCRTKEGFVEEVCFVEVVVWGKKAEGAASLRKGQQVFVNGRLKQDNWIDKKTEEKKSKYIIQADSFVHENELGIEKTIEETPATKLYNAPDNRPPKDPFVRREAPAGKPYKAAPASNSYEDSDLPF